MDIKVMEALLARIPNGDLEALEGLYRDFNHAVYSYSLLLLRDREQAEDNAQDVFLRIWEKASTYRSGGNPKAWIMGITRNSALDRLRKSSREISLDGLPEDELAMAGRMESQTADRIDIRHALSTLQPQDRQIVLLKAVAGLPAKDVGRLLGLPPSTVHWRYQRSLKRLAEWM
jgi:RNA polymerase sigma-70 factor, ECF subfamily